MLAASSHRPSELMLRSVILSECPLSWRTNLPASTSYLHCHVGLDEQQSVTRGTLADEFMACMQMRAQEAWRVGAVLAAGRPFRQVC